MKKFLRFCIYVCILFIISFYISCKNYKSDEKKNYGEKTLELKKIVENNPNIKSLLIESIEKAKQINPDTNTNPAQTLEQYYEFVSWAEKAMPWSLLKNIGYPKLYDKIDQSLSYFFSINDQPLPELEGKGYFNNSLQYVEPYSTWLISFDKAWGKYLDTKESWNEKYYEMALSEDKFGLKNGWYEDPSNWKTFNQFFARYLKSPDMRPIADPNDNSIVVSHSDSEPKGVWKIDSNSNIIEKQGVAIKSGTLYSVEKLIGEDSKYKNEFAGGTFTHSFLDVGDYHRYHFPMSGVVKEIRIIPAQNPSGGYITWDSVNHRYVFDPSSVGWQSLETRGCVILETKEFGLVALLPIGMSPVSSVNFEENIKMGSHVKKGDMLGYFLFGGSDFIMIFQKKTEFILDSPKKKNGESYEHVLMGERIGYLKKDL
jgi:phosphatidylserine decarboxylase precursor